MVAPQLKTDLLSRIPTSEYAPQRTEGRDGRGLLATFRASSFKTAGRGSSTDKRVSKVPCKHRPAVLSALKGRKLWYMSIKTRWTFRRVCWIKEPVIKRILYDSAYMRWKVKVSMRYVVKITESRTVIPKSNGEGGWKLLFNGSRRVVEMRRWWWWPNISTKRVSKHGSNSKFYVYFTTILNTGR